MNALLIVPILLPVITGCFCLVSPWQKLREFFALLGTLLTSAGALAILLEGGLRLQTPWINLPYLRIDFDFFAYHFNGFVLLACSLFGLLITVYSLKQMQSNAHLKAYYTYLLWTVGFANGAVLSNNLIVFLIFWGLIAIMLYLLINIGGTGAQQAAKKSLIIVGGSDFLMLLGVILVWRLAGTLTMSQITIPVKGGLSTFAFILLMSGAIAKAGAMPFHSWIPEAAEVTPTPVMAFLPAALDKLLGIYFLTKICLDLFANTQVMNLVLLAIGAVTIFLSVMMGLMQDDAKKMLGYFVISGAGYMVLGFGTGNLTGTAGGLFYMMSSVLWTPCLFLAIGSVEYRTGITKLDDLGGLARSMPLTFATTLVAVLAISGIPPLNGFASKWMIYQGIIDLGKSGDKLWFIWLLISMFGSALTLAIGVKLIHSVFGGGFSKKMESKFIREVNPWMLTPTVILSVLCVLFGIFAQFPLKYGIGPVLRMEFSGFGEPIHLLGMWSPTLATLLLLSSLLCGAIIYRLGNIKSVKEGEIFVGGEPIDQEEVRIPGTHFYDTIESTGFLRYLYAKGKKRTFDLYKWGRKIIKIFALGLYNGVDRLIDRFYDGIQTITFSSSEVFRKIHTGILTTYILWVLVGITVLLFVLMK